MALSNTVAMDFGRALWGPIGGALFAFMVAFSCFGALNGQFHRFLSKDEFSNLRQARFIRLHDWSMLLVESDTFQRYSENFTQLDIPLSMPLFCNLG